MRDNERTDGPPPERIQVIGPVLEKLGFRTDREKFSSAIRAFKTEDSLMTYGAPIEEITEQDAVTEYYNFLQDVIDTSGADESEEGRRYNEIAKMFKSEAVYLTHDDLLEAILGLADKYSTDLERDADLKLILFCKKDLKHKSQGYVGSSILSQLQSRHEDRVSMADERSINSILESNAGKTKIILCDDWSVTGTGIANDLAAVLQSTHIGNEELDIEISLVCARKDQVEEGIESLDRTAALYNSSVSIVSYFEVPAVESVMQGPNPTGSWSAVDYGFSEQLRFMNSYLRGKGIERDMPHIGTVVSEYK